MLLLPFSVRASDPVFISEVAWAGSSASLADEWFELCGAPGTDVSGWSIEGASAEPLVLPEPSVIPASGAFLIANYAEENEKSALASEAVFVTTSVSLSNSALSIVLRDAAGSIIHTAGDGGVPPAGTSGETKASMERSSQFADWMTASSSYGFDDGAVELGTPGACMAALSEHETEAAVPDSATSTDESAPEETAVPHQAPPPEEPMSPVRISEVYPSPNAGENEWVELVNPSSVGEFLDGWTLEDAAGTKTKLAGLLMPWGRLVIESPKGSLNNDGDTIVLRDRLGRELDRVAYGKTAKGLAVMRVELQDAFVVTLTPTPWSANVLTEERVAPKPETPPKTDTPVPPFLPVIPSEVEKPLAILEAQAVPPLAALGRNDGGVAEKKKPTVKRPVAKVKSSVVRYKGSAYAATIAVPPGVYSKTRAYVILDGSIEELRFSKSPSAGWESGDRISFVAQVKTEGASSFLLANPNSVRETGSVAAPFSEIAAWPDEAGGYAFAAEVVSIRGSALEVKLDGVEGDVLAPVGSSSALKPGDLVRVAGFVSPGARPKVVLPSAESLTLEKAYAADTREDTVPFRPSAPLAIGLTIIAGATGLAAYLRAQRLKRLAMTQSVIEPVAWE